ncbi:MAG: hypothetical protein GX201_11860 [Clostridiales bacterium]|nr:hypothetical protein [Clostridiales bacterium]
MKFVMAKIYPDTIEIYYKDKLIATHERSYLSHHWTIDINHFIHTLKKKPGALHSSVGRCQLSPELQEIYHKYYINNPKDFIVLLELIREKNLESIIKAIKELEKIKIEMVNTENIKNVAFKSPTMDNPSESKDLSIQRASLEQISILNKMFNLNSVGGYEN